VALNAGMAESQRVSEGYVGSAKCRSHEAGVTEVRVLPWERHYRRRQCPTQDVDAALIGTAVAVCYNGGGGRWPDEEVERWPSTS
jgi:hypothetical protein